MYFCSSEDVYEVLVELMNSFKSVTYRATHPTSQKKSNIRKLILKHLNQMVKRLLFYSLVFLHQGLSYTVKWTESDNYYPYGPLI